MRDNHAASDPRTGVIIPYKNGINIVEWKCPLCKHRWWEYSDEIELPIVCPLCGTGLTD